MKSTDSLTIYKNGAQARTAAYHGSKKCIKNGQVDMTHLNM